MKKLLLSALAVSSISAYAAEQPNIVVFFVDDLGWTSLGYQNSKFETPNINKLKEEGLYFSRTYVPTATSSPSRSTLMTGKEALRCGFVRHIYGDDDHNEFQLLDTDPGQMNSRAWLPLEEITYAERLKEMGYYNCFLGKWHLGHEGYGPLEQGFDERHANRESDAFEKMSKDEISKALYDDRHFTDSITSAANNFIKKYDKNQPFLMNVNYYTVHTPHVGRSDYVEKYEKEGRGKVDSNFDAMVAVLDESVGSILSSIEQKGIKENTIIIFTSDQGGYLDNKPLRGLKSDGDTLAEGGCRVPMIIYYPGKKTMGGSYDKPVLTADIYPTLVEIASGKKCKDTQINGESLMTVLNGGKQRDRTIHLFRSYEDQNSAILEDEWKLIKYRSGKIQLYNLAKDMSETTDLAQSEPEKRDYLLSKLMLWEVDATPSYMYEKQDGNTFFIK
ncbi:MAG: sulfatase-like hydrolase/transferase [Rikenellaceae bacterium]